MEPTFSPFGISSVADVAAAGKKLEQSNSNLYFKASKVDKNGNKIIINYQSVLDRHRDVLSKFIETHEFTDLEEQKYRYQPKLFSLDYYGTMELAPWLLRINNMTTLMEFSRKKIKIFKPVIFDLFDELKILEEDELTANRFSIEKI